VILQTQKQGHPLWMIYDLFLLQHFHKAPIQDKEPVTKDIFLLCTEKELFC
jgi:hypothetical protein